MYVNATVMGLGMEDNQRNSPYLGLLPYREQDALFFFGREQETEQIINRVFADTYILVAIVPSLC